MDTTPEMRGKGHATSLMSDVVAFIDDCGKDVWLYAKPARKGLNQDQLETFYSKFGFTKVSMVEGEAKMVRKASV
jgi:predicted GNAT family N-acyltransferase